MPCYNEAPNIRKNIRTVLEDLDALLQLSYELVVVDDGSEDSTAQELNRIAAEDPRVSVIQSGLNSGKGAALQASFRLAKGNLICFLDSDLQISARHIPKFVEYMRLEHADVVIASKRHPLSRVDYPRTRRILSRAYQTLISILFGMPLRDSQAGLKLFKREVFEEVFPRALVKRYAFDVELLANASRFGYRIAEAPVDINGRGTYQSHVDLAAVWRMYWDTMGIFYRMYVKQYYGASRGGLVSHSRVTLIAGHAAVLQAGERYLAAKGLEPQLLLTSNRGATSMQLPMAPSPPSPLTFVCVDRQDGMDDSADSQSADSYLDVLVDLLGKAEKFTCIAFVGPLPPGKTETVIVPYLEEHAERHVGTDFDVVLLPSFVELAQIQPDSQHPQPLVIGSTGPRGLGMLSRAFRDLVPVMTCTDTSTAEMMNHAAHLIRSNVISFANADMNGLPWSRLEVNTLVRGMNRNKKAGESLAEGDGAA
jgi:glycosyltransferase involved in cell wall biosynthesis